MKAIATAMTAQDAAARRLMSAQAIRERGRQMFSLGVSGGLRHFTIDSGRLEATCDYVVRTIRAICTIRQSDADIANKTQRAKRTC